MCGLGRHVGVVGRGVSVESCGAVERWTVQRMRGVVIGILANQRTVRRINGYHNFQFFGNGFYYIFVAQYPVLNTWSVLSCHKRVKTGNEATYHHQVVFVFGSSDAQRSHVVNILVQGILEARGRELKGIPSVIVKTQSFAVSFNELL